MLICFSQILKVHIINVEEYEKQENFYIVLEDPKWLKRGISGKYTSERIWVWLFFCVHLQKNGQEVQHSGQKGLGTLSNNIIKPMRNTV